MMQFTKDKIIAWGLLIIWAAYVLILAYNSDQWSTEVKSSGDFLSAITIYIFGNPHLLLIIIGTVWFKIMRSGTHGFNYLKGLVAGILIAAATDFISFTHCLPNTLASYNSISPNLYLCSDTIFTRPFIQSGINYEWVWQLYYIILPILFVATAILLLSERQFIAKITDQVRRFR